MESIKDTINNVIKDLQEQRKKASDKNSPEKIFKKNLSKKELAHVKFNYFRKGVLGVKVDSSSWLYYLSLQKEAFLDKLRGNLKEIKDIHFSIGDVVSQNEKNKSKTR